MKNTIRYQLNPDISSKPSSLAYCKLPLLNSIASMKLISKNLQNIYTQAINQFKIPWTWESTMRSMKFFLLITHKRGKNELRNSAEMENIFWRSQTMMIRNNLEWMVSIKTEIIWFIYIYIYMAKYAFASVFFILLHICKVLA